MELIRNSKVRSYSTIVSIDSYADLYSLIKQDKKARKLTKRRVC